MIYWTVVIGLAVFYLLGIFVTVHSETAENTKFHEGGFLGTGYTTCSHREATPKDAWLGVIWPLLLLWVIIKAVIWITNDLLSGIFLLFGFRYKKTGFYKIIDRWTD